MAEDTSTIIKATLWVYSEAAKKATSGLIKNWLLIAGSVLAYFIHTMAASIFAPFGFGGGLIVGLISIVLVSIYYSWISDSVQREKLTIKGLFQINYGLFFLVINVGFILWIAEFIVVSLTRDLNVEWIPMCLQLGMVIVFNAIPETIIVHRYEGTMALRHAAVFTRENWIEWFLPLVVLIGPWLAVQPEFALVALAGTDPLLPVSFLLYGAVYLGAVLNLPKFLLVLFALVLANWFMIFRANLFNELESGSRRRRAYQFKQR